MARRTLVSLDLPKSDVESLGLLAATQGVHAAEVVRAAVKHLDSQKLARVVVEALDAPEPEAKAPVVHTSMYLDPSDVRIIDTFAKKLVSTRNAITRLIIRGILSGVVR